MNPNENVTKKTKRQNSATIEKDSIARFSETFEALWRAASQEELSAHFTAAVHRFFPLKGAVLFSPPKNRRPRIAGKSGRLSFPLKELNPLLDNLLRSGKPLWQKHERKSGQSKELSYALIPVGKSLILCVEYLRGRELRAEERQLLLHAVSLFRGIRTHLDLIYEQNRRLSELHVLNRVSQLLNKSLSLEEFFNRLYEEIRQIFQCETHFLGTYDDERQLVTLELFVDEDFVARKKVFRLQDLGFLRQVILTKSPLLISDFDLHLKKGGIRPVLYGKRKTSKSWAGIPLLDNGRVLGVLALGSYTRKIPWEEHLSFLLSLGQIVTSTLKLLQNSESLSISQKKYRTLFRELPAPAALIGTDGSIFETNEAFEQHVRPLLKNKQNILEIAERRESRRRLLRFFREETPFEELLRLPRKSGFDRYFQLTGSPFSFGEKSRPGTLLILEDQSIAFRQQKLLFSLYQMTFEIQRARTRQGILKTAVSSLKQLGFHSFVFMYNPERQVFVLNPFSFSVEDLALFPLTRKMKIFNPSGSIEIPVDTFAALKKTIESLKLIFRDDAESYLRENYSPQLVRDILPGFQKLGLKSTLTIPIHFRGKALGALVLLGEFASRDEFAIFQNLATAMAIALDRAEALEELELSRRKYQTTLEKAGMALWVTDARGTILEMNKAARKLSGKTAAQWLGRPISDLWGEPIDWEKILLKGKKTEKRFGRVELVAENEKRLPVFLIASVFRVESKTFLEWIAWDLRKQERKEKEVARRNKELKALYRVGWQINRSRSVQQLLKNVIREIISLFGVDACGMYTLQQDGRLHLELELGTPPEYNRAIETLSVGEGLAGWIAQHRKPLQVFDLRTCTRLTRKVVLKSGFQSYTGVPILYGKRLVGTLGLLSRVPRILEESEIKLLQTVANELGIAIENVRLNERLEEASRRYRHLFHDAADGMILVDFDRFQIVEANRYMTNKWNIPPEKLVGQNLLDFVSESDRESLIEYLGSLPTQKSRQSLRLHLRGRQDEYFAADIVGGVLNLSRQPFAMLMIRDVTRQIELQEQLRLSQQLAAVGELSAGIAHEIRNPLSAINTSVGMLQYHSDLPADDQELLRIISEESQRLEKVVSEFIQFARPQKPMFERLSLSQLVSDIVRIFQQSADDSVRIIFEKKRDPGPFWFDGNMIRQIVINLLKNALDAIAETPQPTGKIHILLDRRCVDGKPFAELIVRDNGPGIPQEKQGQIFQPFFSTKSDGLGMGLSISRKIVEQHGGRLYLEPDAANGTSFHLLLPLKKRPSSNERMLG